MNRLTFDGNFCDIAMCQEVRGGSFCEDGDCSQRRVWEKLKQYEDIGLTPEELAVIGNLHAIEREIIFDGTEERLRETVYQLRSKKYAKGFGISPRHVGSTSSKEYFEAEEVHETNADRIRAMSDEELARFLAGVENRRSAAGGGAIWNGMAHALEWIQQPAEEDEP